MKWLLLNSGRCDPALNMALDEALLEAASRLGQPALRFYGWTEPAATFGYFQRYAEVEGATHLRPLIRRPTGGGIVPHDADWTYCFVVPPGHEWYLLKAEESYRRIHAWIQSAFARMKIETELAPSRRKSEIDSALRTPRSALPSACFVGHEKFDLLWRGKKIAGAAQRRNQLGLLIQGSVQPPIQKAEGGSQRPERAGWEKSMCRVAEKQFGVRWQVLLPDAALQAHAGELAHQKYSQPSYNCKR
jgi:lipoyl(octanoyl) transferase